MQKEDLIKFEEDVVNMYKQGKLRSPIHLSGSVDGKLEDFLIKLFKEIKPNDWVFSTYRSHYHALLKGIPESWLKEWILNNKSIHVMNKEHKFFTSAIVGGCLPIALGVAMAIKKRGGIGHNYPKKRVDGITTIEIPHVYVFCGDMTCETGGFSECYKYAVNHDLPITFVIEDNGLSTDTITKEVWGFKKRDYIMRKMEYIKYTRKYPHYGCAVYVEFKEDNLKQGGSKF